MKKLITIIAAALCITGASAQIKLGIGPGLQIPTGDFADFAKMGFGGNISGEYLLSEKLGVGLNIGYYSFSEKDEFPGVSTKVGITPIVATGRYYFMTEGLKPYVGLDLGFYAVSTKTDEGGLGGGTTKNSEIDFGLAPVVGAQYEFNDTWALDVNLKYNFIFGDAIDYNIFGINAGIIYTLGR